MRKDLKGYVIGKEGCSIKEIMKSSGAIITSPQRNEDGFFVRGDAGQRECARRLILEKAVRAMCYNNITTNIMSVPNEFSDSLFVFVRGFACMDPGSPLSISCQWETHNTYRWKFFNTKFIIGECELTDFLTTVLSGIKWLMTANNFPYSFGFSTNYRSGNLR